MSDNLKKQKYYFYITPDLQYFAEDSPTGQKTEKGSDKKRSKAREDGDVLKSMEVNTVGILLAGFLALIFAGGFIFENLGKYFIFCVRNINFDFSDSAQLKILFVQALVALALTAGPVVGAVFISALLCNILQVGIIFTTKPFKIDFSKFNPVNGLKKIFTMKNIVEMLKSIGKIAVITYFPFRTIEKNFMTLLNTIKMPIIVGFQVIVDILTKIIWQILAALVIIAIIDYWYQWFTYEKKLKMSKYDVKKEREDSEGKPEVKRAQRKKMFEIMRGDMLKKLPEADVVITNPIHYAVALKYDVDGDSPPYVVAKGALKLALKIKEIAKENNIPIIENKPLARSLYAEVGVGEPIPDEFFTTVAEILAYVYKMKDKKF
ncbi:MAG: flagellar biosynthesis protein FlhB [Candidatus Muirbacterium halophilum]|nr:flagellar biosynthesis protein FlhB [Candidatus Muirbacterium halophilum]MCK9476170.1 flagellar biosynthesis protein FlhB [Candidatus Muirbacterium halophilum]